MAVYRKIDCRISNDKKFRGLSLEARYAWFTILSRRDLAPIGAFKASFETLTIEQRDLEYISDRESLPESLPERLSTSLPDTLNRGYQEGFIEPFFKALFELENNGLIKYDSDAQLIYVPNYLRYNFPESPNVVKTYAAVLDALPECDLLLYALARTVAIFKENEKDSFIKALPKEFIKAYQEGYAKDFKETTVKPSSKAIRKPSLKPSEKTIEKAYPNQEQEHKQEQEKEQEKKVAPLESFAETKPQQEITDQSLSSAPSLETPKKTTKKAAKAASVELQRPDDVSEELWNAFLDHRKSIKKPFNAYALKLMRNQCAIAGWTLSQAMERVLADGWIGFKASFVKDEWIERLPGTGDTPIMVKREDYLRDQFVASDLSMFTPEAADLIQSVGVKNTRPFKDRLKPLKNVHSEKNVSNHGEVSSEDLSADIDAFNDIPDDFKDGGER